MRDLLHRDLELGMNRLQIGTPRDLGISAAQAGQRPGQRPRVGGLLRVVGHLPVGLSTRDSPDLRPRTGCDLAVAVVQVVMRRTFCGARHGRAPTAPQSETGAALSRLYQMRVVTVNARRSAISGQAFYFGQVLPVGALLLRRLARFCSGVDKSPKNLDFISNN